MYTNGIRLDLLHHPLEVERIGRPDLEQVVGLAGDMVALLDLGQRAENASVRSVLGRTGRLADPAEGEDAPADRPGVQAGGVALDHAPRLELLDPLVGRGRAHPHRRPDVREGRPAIPLEDVEDPEIAPAQTVLSRHYSPCLLGDIALTLSIY